jgi:hypothetical protein
MIKLLNLLTDTTPGLNYHLKHNLPISENIYRYSSTAFIQLFSEARTLHRNGDLQLCKEDIALLEDTDIGLYGLYEGKEEALDLPRLDEAEYQGKKVELGKPKRGGAKKFYVYVMNPKTKKVKKVQFGDTTGLSVKIDDPKARQSFAARHQCATKKDKTSPGYWSCNIGRYWKSLGGAKNFSGYW